MDDNVVNQKIQSIWPEYSIEKLLGKGDLLFHPTGNPIIRAQGAFVDVDEISNVLDFIVENNGEASFDPDFLALLAEKENEVMPVKKGNNGAQSKDINLKDKKSDPLLIDAIGLAVANQGISTCFPRQCLLS
jgi:S-DNA-T family DNA segregation ATPase FtsK/SpoIIIE